MTDAPARETDDSRGYRGTADPSKLREVALFFLKLGLVGFGGPLVHIAMMEDELVGEGSRGWSDEATFVEGLAICNMLPGPASTQLGIFMGWVRAGTLGALVAGATFVAPAFLVVVALSYLYFAYGELPSVEAFFYGVNPVVIGLIAGAAYSMARSSLRGERADLAFALGGREWEVDFRLLALLVGAFVAMVGAFAPSFLFITLAFPYVARVRDNDVVRVALVGINAAVVGAIVGATVALAFDALAVAAGTPDALADLPFDPVRLVLAAATFALFARGTNAAYLIVGGGALGAAVYFLV
jgi:chromate transporter